MTQNNIQDWPTELISCIKKGPVAVFLGAGVSIMPPSNLPDGNQLKCDIFDAIISKEKLSESLMENARSVLAKFRPEYFLHIIDEWQGIKWRPLLQFMLEAKMNTNHNIVAYLAQKKILHYILTTNYDTLIEDAFRKYGLPINLHFRDQHFDNFYEDDKLPSIFKIHGSLVDDAGVSSVDTILGSMKEIATSLPQCKTELLKYVIENFVVIFLGYSGLDEFDIYPVLMQSNAKRIIWVSHNDISDPYYIQSFEQVKKQGKHDHIDALIMKNKGSFRIHYYTPLFLSQLSELTTGHRFDIAQYHSVQLRKSGMITPSRHPYQLIGLLLLCSRKWQKAADAFELALKCTQKNTHYHSYIIPEIYRGIGICKKELGNFVYARDSFKKALNILDLTYSDLNNDAPTQTYQHHFSMMSQTCEDIGLTLLAEKDFDEAIDWMHQAISWSKRMVLPKQTEFLARNYGNLGIIHKDRGKDQKDYEDAYYYLYAGLAGEKASGNILGQALYMFYFSELLVRQFRWLDALNICLECMPLLNFLKDSMPKEVVGRIIGTIIYCLCALAKDKKEAENLLKGSSKWEHEVVERCISLYIKAKSKGYVFTDRREKEIGPLNDIFRLVKEEFEGL